VQVLPALVQEFKTYLSPIDGESASLDSSWRENVPDVAG